MAHLTYCLSFTMMFFSLWFAPTSTRVYQETIIRSPEALDLLIRDYAFKSLGSPRRIRTGEIYNVDLPANLSGIRANAARFRCDILRRYGAWIEEFVLDRGLTVEPCLVRVMVVVQEFGLNWSSVYTSKYDLSGYQLVSPIVGITAYNYNSSAEINSNGDPISSSHRFEVGIHSGEGKPFNISFSNSTTTDHDDKYSTPRLLCAMFERNGRVSLKTPTAHRVCVSTESGHYGLVVKSLTPEEEGGGGGKSKPKGRKVTLGVVVGLIGFVALVLVLRWIIEMIKQKRKLVEMERRVYEEEELRFVVVGNVRIPVAGSTRTLPSLELEHA